MLEQILIKGDCLEVMPTLEKFDCIITSPPYNLGVNYSSYKDDKPRNEYLDWINKE